MGWGLPITAVMFQTPEWQAITFGVLMFRVQHGKIFSLENNKKGNCHVNMTFRAEGSSSRNSTVNPPPPQIGPELQRVTWPFTPCTPLCKH